MCHKDNQETNVENSVDSPFSLERMLKSLCVFLLRFQHVLWNLMNMMGL